MRKLTVVGLLIMLTATGCTNRRWGACALGGGLLGAATGAAIATPLAVHSNSDFTDSEVVGISLGSAVGGAVLGTLLGHVLCDPVDEPPPPPPRPAAAPPPPPPAKGTKIATIGEAFFDFNRADLKPSAQDVLADAVKTLKENPSLRVIVEGHTDSVGSDAYNLKLSERRAQAVENYLVRQGIDASRIETRGYGESKPISSNQTAEGRARNRRVEIIAD